MRVAPILLAIAGVFAGSPAVLAGPYNTAEPDEGRLDPNFLGKFRDTLIMLQTIGAPKVEIERPLRKRYLFQEGVYAKVDASKLSAEEKLSFSAVLIRRRRPADAIGLLVPATRQHPELFLLQANLALAYHLNGDKIRARDTQKDCVDSWPKEWHDLNEAQRGFLATIGWNEGPFAHYREAEMYFLKLLRLRSRESQPTFESVDDLFEVKFVGESGEFEPGKIAKSEKGKLPRNALDMVEQLLIWLPEDPRLYWLLGELLNAQGDVKAARQIFDELVRDRNMRAKELMARRQALLSWVDPQAAAKEPFDDNFPNEERKTQLTAFEWRSVSVAFVTGILVAIFGLWQIQEIRRRRRT